MLPNCLSVACVAGLGECLQHQEPGSTHSSVGCMCALRSGSAQLCQGSYSRFLCSRTASASRASALQPRFCAVLCTLLRHAVHASAPCCAAQAFLLHQSKEGLPQEELKRLQALTLSTPSILGLMVGASGRLFCARLPSLALLRCSCML